MPVQKVLSVPTGKLNTSNLSINEIMIKERAKSEHIPEEDLPMETFSNDQLKMAWKQYAFWAKDNQKETLYNAMIKRDPIRGEEDVIRLELDNPVQLSYVEKGLQEMTMFFRKKLQNYRFKIEPFLTENPEASSGYKSPKDQFSAMARKYPNLHSFKSAFNLDFDY